MSIRMIGIDHSKASVEEREVFSFTKKRQAKLLIDLKQIEGIYGGVIISTCNRMELWISCSEEYKDSIYELLCDWNYIEKGQYRGCFVERSKYEAIKHLFYLTCGMKSKILGEDQILSQVKEALRLSRENYCTDKVLEVLFRMAVTAAKKIKTEVQLPAGNSSIIHHVIRQLKCSGYIIDGKRCMVIGNGEMGKLAAMKFQEEGADVLVTVRQYRSGVVEIPKGCKRINYGERLEYIDKYDIILSATASPNMTLTYSQLSEIEYKTPKLFIDLAVPRDIEPRVGSLNNVTLYDIDHFQVELLSAEMKVQIKEMSAILETKIKEYISWYECKDLIPLIQDISEKAAIDIGLRVNQTIQKLDMNQEEKERLEESILAAANKVMDKLMFGVRDTVSTTTLQECVEAMKMIYKES